MTVDAGFWDSAIWYYPLPRDGFIAMSMRTFWSTWSVKEFVFERSKPGASVATEYVPGFSEGASKSPEELVIVR